MMWLLHIISLPWWLLDAAAAETTAYMLFVLLFALCSYLGCHIICVLLWSCLMELFQPKTVILQMTYFFFFCGFPTASVTWTLTAIVLPISNAYILRTPDHN